MSNPAKTHRCTIVTKDGPTDFLLRDPGVGWVVRTEEQCQMPNGNVSYATYVERMLSDVVVQPQGLTLDDFAHESEMAKLYKEFKSFRLPKHTNPPEGAPGGADGDPEGD